ncbi:MAG: S9 family peptidase [Tannerella sp.]|jgi:dipeptidyl aminopeptidase/acylaminoacyl peptidase|nr:S9 family peptidase [Tannerella sp.]
MMYKKLAALLLLGATLSSLHAGEKDTLTEKKPAGIDFFTQVYRIFNLKEKDGNIFFILEKPDRETDAYLRDLYQLIDGQAVRLTRSGNVSDYFFWEDGIVFRQTGDPEEVEKARRGEPLTVFRKLNPKGYQKVTEWLRLPFEAEQIQWIDKAHFFYTSSYDHHFQLLLKASNGNEREARKKREANKKYRIFDEFPFWSSGRGDVSGLRTHLYYYDRGKSTLLTDTLGSSSGIQLSPDKKTLLYTDREAYYGNASGGAAHFIALDVETRTKKEIQLPEKSTGACVRFLNNDEIILAARSAGQENPPALYRLHLKSGKTTKLYESDVYEPGNRIVSDAPSGGDAGITFDGKGIRFIATAVDHAPLIHVSYRDAKVTFLTKAGASIQEYIPFKDGFLAVAQVEQQGSEICFIDRKGSLSPLSSINRPLFDAHHIVKPVEITFTNEEGQKLTGFVLPPVNRQKGKKYPGILAVHGGPGYTYGTVFLHEMQYWAGQGYAVFFTTPAGSRGRGKAFADQQGKVGDADYRDILAFTDAVLKQTDFIDETKTGLTGEWYGGFLTNWVIGHTGRFKAAVSQGGISSWLTFSNISDIGHAFALAGSGADVWKNYSEFWDRSPLKYASQIQTPTLLLHGEDDCRSPLNEGVQMYDALQYFGVPSRMVIFKGEDHHLSRSGKPASRIKRLEEITQWFNRYLKE